MVSCVQNRRVDTARSFGFPFLGLAVRAAFTARPYKIHRPRWRGTCGFAAPPRVVFRSHRRAAWAASSQVGPRGSGESKYPRARSFVRCALEHGTPPSSTARVEEKTSDVVGP
ncbi:hypothetical protein E2562_010414 [Oryza meyeriana var. granulata]|uniref:Uncharacterized protein n=1 Tax=Oryza meyeriana var. granulata TaxID=110450 RepID=A0A6G1F6Q9_9ORYZ|nr:hypothetical protein E2562_010414 [Oryza meyeriana var. granulata]